ncbi:methyltransferase-like protein [Dinothrombium tinctorium]|uniref:Acetylserotonin O-methyltransferase n=1 Tax=Dinothrombium tinctorium TaxID=1965070 RepID=A0A443QQ62_9ACAR|nr:methyltransferase-like protein [Dinothrombium tinctorium]
MSENFSLLSRYLYNGLKTEILFHAVKLNIVDHLLREPMSANDLAQTIQAHPPSLDQFLRYLVLFGIIEYKDGIFSVTSLGSLLSEDHEEGVKYQYLMISNYAMKAAQHLDHTIRTGGVALEHAFGMTLFDYLKQHPEDNVCFLKFVKKRSKVFARQLLSVYDFSPFKHIIDVGGADGTLLIEILKSTPNVQGTLFDLPHVAEEAAKMIAENKLGERCKTAGGSFFDSLPAMGDCYILKHILHDWNDEKCEQILRNVGKSMDPESKLLIMESILTPDDYDLQMRDFVMWIQTDGKERSISDFEALLKSADFKIFRLITMPAGKYTIIETVLNK